jgi:DNA-binding CsgD family transcriptional regulator
VEAGELRNGGTRAVSGTLVLTRAMSDTRAAARVEHLGLLRALDVLERAVAYFDCAGDLFYANPAFARELENCPASAWLHQEIRAFVDVLCARSSSEERASGERRVEREVAHGRIRYRLKGGPIPLGSGPPGDVVVVMVDSPPLFPSDLALRERFGLSRQESRILRLLIDGRSNMEIARVLSISSHTVRHHLESIFPKLRVRSRTEIASKLLRAEEE